MQRTIFTMASKIFKCLIVICAFSLISVHAKSFTLVIDTTTSMDYELSIIQENIPVVLNNTREISIENYIVVPFDDPNVGTPTILNSPERLIHSINNLAVATQSDGIDCPENVLSGIQTALEVSKLNSYIFVFTDAYAKDLGKLSAIEDLCRNTKSQVFVFLSGDCLLSDLEQGSSFEVYYSITESCQGNLIGLIHSNFRQAFIFMREIMKYDWTHIRTENVLTRSKQIYLPLFPFTTDLIVTVSGNNQHLQIEDDQGQSPRRQTIVDTKNSTTVRIIDPEGSDYKILILCDGFTSVTFYKRDVLPFRFGFSTGRPESIRETSSRPMPDAENYMLLVILPNYDVELDFLQIQMTATGDIKNFTLEEINVNPRKYLVKSYFRSEEYFRITVFGSDRSNYPFSVTSQTVEPQRIENGKKSSTPTIEFVGPEEVWVDYRSNIRIPCKVSAHPKPTIWFEDSDGETLPSETILLEMPNLYISYATIENFNRNDTIQCKCTNTEGQISQSTDLFVNRTYTFDVIQEPTDTAIEYGTDGTLYCDVDAYPEATIKWYHNDSEVESTDNIEINTDDNSLSIKNINLNDSGVYNCEATNEIETKQFSATITISGLEAPELKLDTSEVAVRLGDSVQVECRFVKGKPSPDLTWKYKSVNSYSYEDIPIDATVDDGKLKIDEIKAYHNGIYKCEAVNIQGMDSREVTIKIQSPPKILDTEIETMVVQEADKVILTCNVDADANASVRWEMIQKNGTLVTQFEGHTTDKKNTHRFYATWKDSGIYQCIAENPMGRAMKTVTVDVLVEPYIQPPQDIKVEARSGTSITLPCNILYGHPVPSTRWEFSAPKSTPIILSRGMSTNPLHLTNLSKADEGTYICIAQNELNTDSITISVSVHN